MPKKTKVLFVGKRDKTEQGTDLGAAGSACEKKAFPTMVCQKFHTPLNHLIGLLYVLV